MVTLAGVTDKNLRGSSVDHSPINGSRGFPVKFELESLITFSDPSDLAPRSLADLRSVRTQYEEIENGLSYSRRIIQGRLDTIAVELDRRSEGAADNDVLSRLPDALAAHTRGPGLPRHAGELEPPEWSDQITGELDEILTPMSLSRLTELDESELRRAAANIAKLEREVSEFRREIHRRIDRLQEELISRYQSGATVDDLLA